MPSDVSQPSASFAYDARGNLIGSGTSTYSYDGSNRLSEAPGVVLGYDARGNLTSSGSASYSYGPENLLAATNGGLSFYYDGVGRLVEYNSSVSTRFFYDGNQMAAEVANPGGGIMRRYVWGAGVDEPLVWYEGSGTGDKRDDGRPVPRTGLGSMGCFPPLSLHADERGSVVAIRNGAGTAHPSDGDPYGNRTRVSAVKGPRPNR